MRKVPACYLLPLIVAAGSVTACVSVDNATSSSDSTVASTPLARSDGAAAGEARLRALGSRLVLQVTAQGLPPGPHGLHLHTVGRCDPPDFASAQGHWNPTTRQHGSANPAGPHAGDLPNLTIGSDGRGRLETLLNPQARAAGTAGIFDADGTALVVHAAADDLRTDPSGASGARIACGVLVRP